MLLVAACHGSAYLEAGLLAAAAAATTAEAVCCQLILLYEEVAQVNGTLPQLEATCRGTSSSDGNTAADDSCIIAEASTPRLLEKLQVQGRRDLARTFDMPQQ